MSRKPNAQTGIVLLLLCLTCLPAVAGPPDSAAIRPNTRPGGGMGFDNRFFFVRRAPVRACSQHAGVEHQNRSRFGLGGYPPRKHHLDRTYGVVWNRPDTARPLPDLSSGTPNFAYRFLSSRRVEWCAPLEVGLGTSHFTLLGNRQARIWERKGLFVPAAGLDTLVQSTRWVGFSAAVGYRKPLSEVNSGDDFDWAAICGWCHCYGVNGFLGNLLDDYRQQHERKRYKAAIPPSPEF